MRQALALLAISLVSTYGLLINPRSTASSTPSSQSDELMNSLLQMTNVLKKQNKDDPRINLLQALKPCAKCSAPKRYGALNDGGYAMCSELMQEGKIKGAYSIGINGFDNWGADVSTQLNVPVYQFDCTNSARPPCQVNEGEAVRQGCDFHFYDLCLAATPQALPAQRGGQAMPRQANFKTLSEMMEMQGHGKRGDTSDLLLQLDVEGHEWEILAQPSMSDTLKEFSQISIEFHNIIQPGNDPALRNNVPTATKLLALQNLNKHFVLTHLHGNNFAGTERMQDPSNIKEIYSIPKALEALYVRRGQVGEHACEADPQYLPQDTPNTGGFTDMAAPHLPK